MFSRHMIILFLGLLCMFSNHSHAQKINGVCTVAPPYEVIDEYFEPIVSIHANWIAVVPYAFCDPAHPTITYNHQHQWSGEKPEGIKTTVQLAKARGLKVLLKPHLWVKGQGWAGDLKFTNTEDLKIWQNSYREYLLFYSSLADSLEVEMISIGTEIKQLIVQNETYWTDLNCDIRNVYSGKLTYSANWDNYDNIPIWDQLDYIGIDAYFPVNDSQTPDAKEVADSFEKDKNRLQKLSHKLNKPVLFTEFGFRSIDHCSNGHWVGDYEEASLNMECQKNAYAGFFNTFWQEPWFAGGFAWKWFFKHEEAGGNEDSKFTPQNKPAEEIICQSYSSL